MLRSVLPGASQSMTQLIGFRVLQGIGAGGDFALTYTVRCRRFASKKIRLLCRNLCVRKWRRLLVGLRSGFRSLFVDGALRSVSWGPSRIGLSHERSNPVDVSKVTPDELLEF